MSVIGRLDKQVDEVLIAPLEKKEKEASREQPEHSDSDESVDNVRREVNQTVKEDSLPVWML
jgi:hypothetical protein